MSNTVFTIEQLKNEPVRSYVPGSPERQSLKAELARQAAVQLEIPVIAGRGAQGDELRMDAI